MKQMPIMWTRLVKDGATCTRCGATGQELAAAVPKLADALRPLGIEPVLETREIDEEAFTADPAASNRVWIDGRPIEQWLGADVGMSRCCSVCGESDCRTLELGGRSYEAIPQAQLIRAGLLAASRMLAEPPAPHGGAGACCDGSPASAPCPPAAAPAAAGCR